MRYFGNVYRVKDFGDEETKLRHSDLSYEANEYYSFTSPIWIGEVERDTSEDGDLENYEVVGYIWLACAAGAREVTELLRYWNSLSSLLSLKDLNKSLEEEYHEIMERGKDGEEKEKEEERKRISLIGKKYELTDETIEYDGKTLYRIRALRDFGWLVKGDLGGFVQSEENLSHEGDCWIFDEGIVCDSARVIEDAKVLNHARVRGNSCISCEAVVRNYAVVLNSKVSDSARVIDNALVVCSEVMGLAVVDGNAELYDTKTDVSHQPPKAQDVNQENETETEREM